jgi:hypothetical protein
MRTSTACYGDSFSFYMWTMFIPDRKHTCGPPRPVTGIAYSAMYEVFVTDLGTVETQQLGWLDFTNSQTRNDFNVDSDM